MDGRCHRIGAARGCDAIGNGEHDRVAVRHNGDLHGVFGIVSVRNIDVVGQRRAGELAADIGDVHQYMFGAELLGAQAGKLQLFPVALAIVEGDEAGKLVVLRDPVRKGDGIHSAGTDDKCFQR